MPRPQEIADGASFCFLLLSGGLEDEGLDIVHPLAHAQGADPPLLPSAAGAVDGQVPEEAVPLQGAAAVRAGEVQQDQPAHILRLGLVALVPLGQQICQGAAVVPVGQQLQQRGEGGALRGEGEFDLRGRSGTLLGVDPDGHAGLRIGPVGELGEAHGAGIPQEGQGQDRQGGQEPQQTGPQFVGCLGGGIGRHGGAPFCTDGCGIVESLAQEAAVEAVGQEILQGQRQGLALPVDQDDFHLQLWVKFRQHLAADAAGGGEPLRGGGNGDADEFPVPLADRLEYGGALGAVGGGVAGVFHIAAGEYRAVVALQGGPHGEVGVGDVGHVQHFGGLLAESLFIHSCAPFCFCRLRRRGVVLLP